MAPEAYISNAKLNGEKLDTFAMGVTLLEMIMMSGQDEECNPPFEKATKEDALFGIFIEDMVKNDSNKFFATLGNLKSKCENYNPFEENSALVELLKSMLHPIPEKRPSLTELIKNSKWLSVSSLPNDNPNLNCD